MFGSQWPGIVHNTEVVAGELAAEPDRWTEHAQRVPVSRVYRHEHFNRQTQSQFDSNRKLAHISSLSCFSSLLYSAILCSRADSLRFCCMIFCISDYNSLLDLFLIFNIHRSGVLAMLFGCYMAGATRNCCGLGAFCIHHTIMHKVTPLHVKPFACRAHACLTCTCTFGRLIGIFHRLLR